MLAMNRATVLRRMFLATMLADVGTRIAANSGKTSGLHRRCHSFVVEDFFQKLSSV
jgi:hypothetical protein